LPEDYRLPAHERLAKKGIVFQNHRINSCVCTPSRSVLYTGQHIQHTKMFDNTNFPWISSMSTDLHTIGDMLREAGYYTAYKGKWHLTKEFETVNELGSPTKIFTKEMEAYGFSDYVGVGGPNIAPPDESPIAQCVDSAPGGPVHVLISDSEAEHIPGCNMAFRKECLEAIGGFDPRFRAARFSASVRRHSTNTVSTSRRTAKVRHPHLGQAADQDCESEPT
jgi:hypothetical protein